METRAETVNRLIQADDQQEQCHTDFKGRCLHCGVLSSTPFCCAGCKVVFDLLTDCGLTEYYKWREPRAAQPQHAPPDLFRDFEHLSGTPAPHQESFFTFELSGIHCAGCLWLLERLAELHQGIRRSELTFSTGQLRVWYEPSLVSLSAIARLLDQLGYPPNMPRQGERNVAVEKSSLLRLGIAAFCAMNTMLLAVALFEGLFSGIEETIASAFRWISMVIAAPAVFWAATPLYEQAWKAVRRGAIHIELPLVLAIISAYLLSAANTLLGRPFVYFDSVCLLIFLLLAARHIQQIAIRNAQREARRGWSLLPATARRCEGEKVVTTPIEQLVTGDLVIVAPGERFPADGTIVKGQSSVDLSVLTGESSAVSISEGSDVIGGSMNLSGEAAMRVGAVGALSRVGKLLGNLRSGDPRKGTLTRFTDRVGRWYLQVLGLAALTIIYIYLDTPSVAIERVLTLFIVTCPCALAFAVPTIYGCAIGDASAKGILIKSTRVLEELPRVRTAFIDKTGTLTAGSLHLDREEWLQAPAGALPALNSLTALVPTHPVSAALRKALRLTSETSSTAFHVAGRGVELEHDDGVWRLGSPPWCGDGGTTVDTTQGYTVVSLSRNGHTVARFRFRDRLRPHAREALQEMKDSGYSIALLSGDDSNTVRCFASQCGADMSRSRGGLSPQEKADIVAAATGESLFLGDGVNDALAIQRATVGVAFASGLETTVEAADVVITVASFKSITELIHGATRMRRVVVAILGLSVLYNISAGIVAILGLMNPLIAAILMPTSSSLSILLSIMYRPFKANG